MASVSIGATVRLKSGGPLMTVGGVADQLEDGDGLILKCDWVDSTGKPHTVLYRREQVELDNDEIGEIISI